MLLNSQSCKDFVPALSKSFRRFSEFPKQPDHIEALSDSPSQMKVHSASEYIQLIRLTGALRSDISLWSMQKQDSECSNNVT